MHLLRNTTSNPINNAARSATATASAIIHELVFRVALFCLLFFTADKVKLSSDSRKQTPFGPSQNS
ncbi:hypothetical protein DL98DRAFT_517091 [Cadophora sp. DSE1049]|nr:hypothetical protein DL98DRAFT_517091 [Cadophora sp. DSE1049]